MCMPRVRPDSRPSSVFWKSSQVAGCERHLPALSDGDAVMYRIPLLSSTNVAKLARWLESLTGAGVSYKPLQFLAAQHNVSMIQDHGLLMQPARCRWTMKQSPRPSVKC